MLNSQRSAQRYLAFIILLVSLALLAVTQYLFNFAYWFNVDLTPWGFLRPLACLWPDFCTALRFPPYGFIALLAALLAALLFGGWFASQKLPALLTEPVFLPLKSPRSARLNPQVDGALLVVLGLCQVYVSVQALQDQPVFPVIWLVGLLTLVLLGWRLDRSRTDAGSRRRLSPTLLNAWYVSAIACLLLTTAALQAQRWLWVGIFGTATVLLAWQVLRSSWRSWDVAGRLERLALPLITLGSFLLFSFGLNNWAWSFVGDEYLFYDLGLRFANGTMTDPLLSGAGVYGYHPVLSSVWQGLTMWLFGADSYGWRVSNALLLALSIPFFYYFLRPILGRAGSCFAVTLYGSAHVLLTVGHTGYNNAQVIFVMAASLAALVWAGRRGSWAGFILVGICLGLGFYTFAVARIYSLIIAVWLAIYYFPISWRARRIAWSNGGVWLVVVGTALLTALPVLSTRLAWAGLARQTLLTGNAALSDQLNQLLHNTLYGLTAFLFNDQNDLWIFGAHADPITSTLMVLGLAVVLWPDRRAWRVRICLLASYVVFVIIVAGTQQYDYPSVTRIFSFVPFYAIFAAIGLLAIGRLLRAGPSDNSSGWLPQAVLAGSAIVVAGVIVPLNVWQSVDLSLQHTPQRPAAFLLQAAQMSAAEAGSGPQLFYVADPQSENWAKVLYSIYDIPLDRFTFVLPRTALRPNNVICQATDQPALVMIAPETQDAALIAASLRDCWPGSELRLLKDMYGFVAQYRLVNQSAAPFMHTAGGYWREEVLPPDAVSSTADNLFAWTVYQPVGLAQNSSGRLAVVEAATNQVVWLDSSGRAQGTVESAFVSPSSVGFLPDDRLVVADAGQGLLWFDPNGQFQLKSDGGSSPRGLFVAADGTIYLASTGGASIVQVSNTGEILRTINSPQFQQPTSVAVALDGRIAVGDPVAGKVTIHSHDGELLTEYPIGLGDTMIDKPGLLWLPDGGFIFTDPVNNRMVQLDPAGHTVKEWSDLKTPTSLILQAPDHLLVLESRNDRITSISLK